ncbi:MAG: GAF domain-containing protein [Chloroflexota bacterium]
MDSQKRSSLLLTRSFSLKWGIVLGLTAVYILSFRTILAAFGPAGTPLIALPVIAAGWFFSLPGGVIASLLAVPVVIFLFLLNGYGPISQIVSEAIPGLSILVFVGVITGGLRKWVDDTLRVEAALRSRERYFALTNIMTQTILAGKAPEEMYDHLVIHLTNLFEADSAYLTKWDEEHDQNTLVAATLPIETPLTGLPISPGEASLVEAVMQGGHALAIDDAADSPYNITLAVSGSQSQQAHSALGIPIMVREYKFGAAVVCFDAPHPFTEEDMSRAEQIGKNICLALWSIQQNEEIQKRLREADALAKIERALSETERVGLKTVLQIIVDSAKALIAGSEQAVIHLLEEKQQLLVPQAVAGFNTPQEGRSSMRLGEGAAGQAIARGEVINIPDIANDSRFINPASPPNYRSLLVAPIQSTGKPIGAISVQSNRIPGFSRNDERLIQTLSTQAAIAIENARLLETTRQSLKEVEALYRINQGLVASVESGHLIKQVVNLLQRNFGYYHVQVYIVNPESGDLVLREGTGKIGTKLKQRGHRLPAGAGIVGHAAETGQAFMTNDVEQVIFFYRNPLLPDTKAELAAPIKIEGKVVGVLDIQHQTPGQLNERHLQLVSAVADQLAVALQKADLYTDLQHALDQEKAMRAQLIQSERLTVMGRLLASVSHELNNPLQAIQNALFLLKEERDISAQGQQDLEIVLSESERMAAMIARLRATYRPVQDEDFQPVDINNLVEDVYALVATHLRHNGISFAFHPDPNLPAVPGLADQLRQVFLNLLMNAVEAMTTGGRLDVCTRSLPENSEVFLSVADNGPGIEPSILPNIFDAFVTGKQSGTGLGLTISYDIILKHRGRIQAENNPKGGATFNIWLPIGTEKGA